MHPFSVMQSFPTGRFITLCFYCFFCLKSFFSGYKKTALRLFLGARYKREKNRKKIPYLSTNYPHRTVMLSPVRFTSCLTTRLS